MPAPFASLPIGASFTLSGIAYRKTSDITAESAFSVAIMGGAETVTV